MIDNDGFCQQIRGLEDAMYALAYSILRNDQDAADAISESILNQDAADAISESILKAYCALPQLKNRNAFKSWMLKIVNNTSVEMLRKKLPTAQVGEDFDIPAEDDRLDCSTKMVLREAVDHLAQPYRTVVTLFYYEDLSVMEISAVTGQSVIAIRKQLSRARTMLRESLNKEDFF